MGFELYDEGKELLRNEDNLEWIDKVTCWVEKELDYNIYVFQVVIDSPREIEIYYETITASIAVDFQSNLEKAIEKWNIYLVFECKETVDWEIRLKVEKDKYAVRKLIWDGLNDEELDKKEYLRKRLLSLEINEKIERPKEKGNLLKLIEEKDYELYKILKRKNLSIEEKVAMYMGDGIYE